MSRENNPEPLPFGMGKPDCWACGGVGVLVIEREEYACFVCCPVKKKKAKKAVKK
jgi:hypothetical protein